MRKIKIGITGGIGTGKTLFASFLEEKGYKVIVADEISKDLMNNDPDLKNKIIKNFGKDSYKEGKLNTKFLADKIFSDSGKLHKINSLVHPPTIEEIKKQMDTELKQKKLVFVESAIIFDVKIESLFNFVILLTSSDENKIERILGRGKSTKKEIEKRIAMQLPDNQKKSKADFVIANDGTAEQLKEKAYFIVSLLEQM